MASRRQEMLGRYLDQIRAESEGDDDLGWSLFSSIAKGLKKTGGALKSAENVAFKAVETPMHLASKIYENVTPSDLQKVLRWTPAGLVVRAGYKLEPHAKEALNQVVKWSPYGMVYRGAVHALPAAESALNKT